MASRFRLVIPVLLLLLAGCAMTPDRLVNDITVKTSRLKSYYAELDVIVFSLEGKQDYRVRQWLQLPGLWRIEVDFNGQQQVFLCDGEDITVYQPGIKEYFRCKADKPHEIHPPFMLFDYLKHIPEANSLQLLGSEKIDRHKYHIITSDGSLQGETVKMWLESKNLFPGFVEIYQDGILLNKITCTHLDLNPNIPSDLFTFSESEGNEVAHQCLIRPLSLSEAKREWMLPLYVPEYLPEGTKLFSITRTIEGEQEQLILVYDGRKSFTFVQREKSSNLVQLTPGLREVTIGNLEGYYQKNSLDDLNTLWWNNKTHDFILTGSISLEDMLLVADSLKVE